MLQKVRAEKVGEKMGSFVQFPCSLPGFRSLNCQKKVHFLQFCADLSKKPKSVKAIYINASKSSHYTLSENGMVYRCLEPPFMIISVIKIYFN